MTERVLAALMVAGAWACYLPLGSKYATVLSGALVAAHLLRHRDGSASPLRQAPALVPICALLLWLGLTAGWSPAPWTTSLSQLAQYGLLLVVPVIASACPGASARRALQHFVWASTAVATVLALAKAGWLPASPLVWHTTVDAEGNQRIATSVLLALGAGLALWFAADVSSWQRWAWLAGAAWCAAGIAWQDRRTGMVVLPVVLLAWVLARPSSIARRLAMITAIGLSAVLVWQVSDAVRSRFAEGLAELRQYPSDDTVATSWGQRIRLWQVTAAMVMERPVAGHGLGSWRLDWQQRVTPGTALAEHSTPHNTYLQLAHQGGAIALALWLWVLASALRRGIQRGHVGAPTVMAWTTVACVGLFNAGLRDAKFALPLLLLAALATALARAHPAGQPERPG